MNDFEHMPIFDSQSVEAKCEEKKVENLKFGNINEKSKKKYKNLRKGKSPKNCQKMKKMMKCMKIQKMKVPPFYGYSIPPPFWGRAYFNHCFYGMTRPPMLEFKYFHIPHLVPMFNFNHFQKNYQFEMPSSPKFEFKHFYKRCRN